MNIVSEIRLLVKVNKLAKIYFGENPTMKSLLTNWKTTLAGAVSILCLVGGSMGFLTPVQVAAISGVANAFGFLSAKDGNVTGGTKTQ